jgi:hypothetical protein
MPAAGGSCGFFGQAAKTLSLTGGSRSAAATAQMEPRNLDDWSELWSDDKPRGRGRGSRPLAPSSD